MAKYFLRSFVIVSLTFYSSMRQYYDTGCASSLVAQFHRTLLHMPELSKFGAIRNSGDFSFLSNSHFWEVLELPFSAELKTTCSHLNMVYKMYLSCNFE